MKILEVTQGSPEWHAARAQHDCASDATAMMGASPYVTRSELLKRRATGMTEEIDSGTQYLFDKGHAAEAAIRPYVESLIGEDLFPAVGVEGSMLASFDGLTMAGDVVFEHKLYSKALADRVRAGELEPSHYWQLEHQLLVSGAKAVIFVVSDGTPEKCEHMFYGSVPGRAEALKAGWAQFHADLAAYKSEPAKAAPVAASVEGFGALSLRVEGRVLASNLDAFKAGADAFIARLPKPAELQTDQDFANADAAVKACAEAEDRIKAAKGAALAQMADVDAVLRTADIIAEAIRGARLALDKAVKAEKENRRAELVRAGVDAVRAHYTAINATMTGFEISAPASLITDLGSSIKGLKSLDSIRDKISTAVAQAKIAASQDADRRRACIAVLPDDRALVPDAATLVASKSPDDLRNLIAARIAERKAKEDARIEADRARIRAEEEAKAKREADAKAEQDRQRIREEERQKLAAAEKQRIADEVAAFGIAVESKLAPTQPRQPTLADFGKPRPAPSRPTDAQIIKALALHFRVHESKVIEWLIEFDAEAASAEMAKEFG